MKVFVGILSGVVFLTGCSFSASVGGGSLDQKEVETEILEGLTESVGVEPKAIDCNGIEDLDVEEGNTFQCSGTAPNGDLFDVDVTLTNDDGEFTAIVPG